MSRTHICLLLLFSGASAAACAEHKPTPAPAAAVAPPPNSADPAAPRLSLWDRLSHEATHRPAFPAATAGARARPEVVAQALAARGMPLERWKQVLASPLGARYCMAGQTAVGNVVAVCEFGDDAEAAAGLAYSHKTFDPLIPNRALVQHGPAVLTVTRPGGESGQIAEARTVTEIFASL